MYFANREGEGGMSSSTKRAALYVTVPKPLVEPVGETAVQRLELVQRVVVRGKSESLTRF
jgi:hypothetical protein